MKPNDKAYREFMCVFHKTHLDIESQIKASLTAAYAAQFPPSEDYAGLVKMLRSLHKQITSVIKQDDPWVVIDETVPSKAADALEAVLAERDRLNGVIQSYQILLETQQSMLVATQTERDAILARLAPVDNEALVEIVAKSDADFDGRPFVGLGRADKDRYLLRARAAIAAVRPHIEAAEREKCAKIAELHSYPMKTVAGTGYNNAAKEIAAAIRSGK